LNTFVLAMDKHPIDEEVDEIIERVNTVFGLLFIIEMVI
jgi:hypothetical protein